MREKDQTPNDISIPSFLLISIFHLADNDTSLRDV